MPCSRYWIALCAIGTAAAIGVTAGCDKKKTEGERLTRSGGKPAVVVVGQPDQSLSSTMEAEPNGESSQAQRLVVDSVMRGVLEGSEDVDRFFVIPEVSGLLFAEVSGGGEADLAMSLGDAKGELLAKSDRGPAGTPEGLPGFGVEAGVRYELTISEFVGRKLRKAGGRQGPSAEYRLQWRIEEDAQDEFEREPNAEESGASEVLVGEDRRGYVGWSGDVDLWKLPVSDSGEVAASIQTGAAGTKEALHIVLSPVPGVATTLALLSPDGAVIAERQAGKGQELAIRNFVPIVGLDSYWVRVSGKPSNPQDSYGLRVDAVEIGPGTEEEPNDTLEKATPLGGDESSLVIARGELTEADVDVFQLSPVSHDRILDLRLSGPSSADLDVAVLAESGAVLIESKNEGEGAHEALRSVPVAAGSAPLIRVVPRSVEGPAEYELSLSLVRGTAPPLPPIATESTDSPSQRE